MRSKSLISWIKANNQSNPMMWVNPATGASTWSSGTGGAYTSATTTNTISHAQAIMNQQYWPDYSDQPMADPHLLVITDGVKRTIKLPDGTVIYVEKDGSFRIDDAQAKVVYRANRVRSFNPFLNASDKLEEFIKFCGDAGVRQGEMLGIPIKHFIAWLVIEAAKSDGETPSEQPIPALPDLSKPRCRVCKRFMSSRLKADRIEFCRPVCLERKLNESSNASVLCLPAPT